MATIPIPPDFSEFLKLLNEHKVKYLIIGGYAVSFHGYVRATGDMDIWIKRDAKNAKKMIQVFDKFGFNSNNLQLDIFLNPKNVVRMGVPPVRIEIMNSISGVGFDECYKKRVKDNWNNIPVSIISLDKLKANKRASGRLKDLSDLEHLK